MFPLRRPSTWRRGIPQFSSSPDSGIPRSIAAARNIISVASMRLSSCCWSIHSRSGNGSSRGAARSWCTSNKLQYLKGSAHLSVAKPAVQAATRSGSMSGRASRLSVARCNPAQHFAPASSRASGTSRPDRRRSRTTASGRQCCRSCRSHVSRGQPALRAGGVDVTPVYVEAIGISLNWQPFASRQSRAC